MSFCICSEFRDILQLFIEKMNGWQILHKNQIRLQINCTANISNTEIVAVNSIKCVKKGMFNKDDPNIIHDTGEHQTKITGLSEKNEVDECEESDMS